MKKKRKWKVIVWNMRTSGRFREEDKENGGKYHAPTFSIEGEER